MKDAEKKINRHSIYLTEKAEALEKAIDFFLGAKGKKSATMRRLVFLAQIDFWNWEIDELIFSFSNFKKRKEVWESRASLEDGLKEHGFLLRDKAKWKARWCFFESEYLKQRKLELKAPTEALERVIEKWNRLLGLLEKNVLVDEEYVKQYKVNAKCNLTCFRKERPLVK